MLAMFAPARPVNMQLDPAHAAALAHPQPAAQEQGIVSSATTKGGLGISFARAFHKSRSVPR